MNGVTRNQDIQGGRPCLHGTRYPTETVLGFDGDVVAIKSAFPWLSVEQIETACRFERSWHRRAGRALWRLRVRVAALLLGADVETLEDGGLC